MSSHTTTCRAEAQQARAILGSSLIGYEIGNEPEFYRYGYGTQTDHANEFAGAWESFRGAILKSDPLARFYGPVGGEYLPFLQTFVNDKSRELAEVDQHYYEDRATSMPISPFTTDAANYTSYFQTVESLAQSAGLPYRVGETSLFGHGGLSGRSQ